ncbi:hypothetical protein CLOM_g13954, partial [Closterium sp. NIES-68]
LRQTLPSSLLPSLPPIAPPCHPFGRPPSPILLHRATPYLTASPSSPARPLTPPSPRPQPHHPAPPFLHLPTSPAPALAPVHAPAIPPGIPPPRGTCHTSAAAVGGVLSCLEEGAGRSGDGCKGRGGSGWGRR